MLSDEQLIDQLCRELAPLEPRGDLAARVREQARNSAQPLRRAGRRGGTRRPGISARRLVVVAGAAIVVAVGAVMLVGSETHPEATINRPGHAHVSGRSTSPGNVPLAARRARGSRFPRARAGAGPVTCHAGSCRQGHRRVRDPSGSHCGQYMIWVARTTAPARTYACARNAPVSGY